MHLLDQFGRGQVRCHGAFREFPGTPYFPPPFICCERGLHGETLYVHEFTNVRPEEDVVGASFGQYTLKRCTTKNIPEPLILPKRVRIRVLL